MKKLVFAFVALLLVGSLSAQDHEKAYKKAKKLLGTYNMSPKENSDKLEQAKEKIDYAMTGDLSGIKNPQDPYQIKGDIYNTIASTQITAANLAKQGEEIASKGAPAVAADNPATEAYEAYVKALELGTKSGHKKKALAGLNENQNHIQNTALLAYEAKDYEKALNNFIAVVTAHDLLKSKSSSSLLDGVGEAHGKENYDYQHYLIGLAGLNAKKYDVTKPFLVKLYEKKYDDALVYSSLYAIEAETDAEGAYKYLEAGREKYPDDNGLLFEEINHFLRIGKLDELIERLEKAIEIEPDNVSLYTTLGNVYDNLYQAAVKEGGSDKEQSYFDNAFKNYSAAVEKEPKNVDAHYSMGALYFNKAALVTQEMIKLNDDLTKSGMKKYDAFKAQSVELFNQALPHFKKAESLNANDTNTLLALKEIYARIDDIVKSNEFKTRYEKIQNGETNASSYFNE